MTRLVTVGRAQGREAAAGGRDENRDCKVKQKQVGICFRIVCLQPPFTRKIKGTTTQVRHAQSAIGVHGAPQMSRFRQEFEPSRRWQKREE